MIKPGTRALYRALTEAQPWESRDLPVTIYQALCDVAERHPTRPAVSFQLHSDPQARAQTLTWSDLLARTTQVANLLRGLDVQEGDVVAYILPNCLETATLLLGGATAGIVNPINPLLSPPKIAAILRQTRAKVVVTLRAFPQSDIAAKVAEALRHTPEVRTLVEVDLKSYVPAPKSWLLPLVRPKASPPPAGITRVDFARSVARQPADRLTFADHPRDRVAAQFHTGGTTGMPKITQHRYSGMIYNGWVGAEVLFSPEDVLICPLPLFHVFAAYPVLMSAVMSGAHVVMPTPGGYRGAGVFDNFWKLIERWQATFLITVPTAISALMQRPVDADVSSLRMAISGSAPLPVELYARFKAATGVEIAEGYGLTECTCLVACNPTEGEKKIGSVGLPFPYTEIVILRDGRPCGVEEVGEICVSNPGVYVGATYTEGHLNEGLFYDNRYLRTGDMGRMDSDGYLWITGRAKDLIIRGGHNIDPAQIEEALLKHPAVAFAGAVGQPDPVAGELPCVYVELVGGQSLPEAALLAFVASQISERAAVPKYLEILPELPKTGVGKIYKPDLRRRAIARVFAQALAQAGLAVEVVQVVDDAKRGFVVHLRPTEGATPEAIARALSLYTVGYELV